jgi:hypothetical protein
MYLTISTAFMLDSPSEIIYGSSVEKIPALAERRARARDSSTWQRSTCARRGDCTDSMHG